jgi:hypothetical protein
LNYTNVWSISHREKAYVRLGEIADLFDLANHPEFRGEKFLSLVEQFNAGHAVAWAASVARSLFGKNPLPMSSTAQLDGDLPGGRFPCCLWWNFWAGLRFGADDLLARRWLDMASLVKQLGENTLGATGKYSTFDGEATKPLRRLITLATAEDPVTKIGIGSNPRCKSGSTSCDGAAIISDRCLAAAENRFNVPAQIHQALSCLVCHASDAADGINRFGDMRNSYRLIRDLLPVADTRAKFRVIAGRVCAIDNSIVSVRRVQIVFGPFAVRIAVRSTAHHIS